MKTYENMTVGELQNHLNNYDPDDLVVMRLCFQDIHTNMSYDVETEIKSFESLEISKDEMKYMNKNDIHPKTQRCTRINCARFEMNKEKVSGQYNWYKKT